MTAPFKSISYTGRHPGRRLIVLGGVHGNETCGTAAIERVVGDIEAGAIEMMAGRVTFVPVANPLALERRQRAGDRNLNRGLAPSERPASTRTTSRTGSAPCSSNTKCCWTCIRFRLATHRS